MISVGEQAGLIPATCSWDDNVCVRYVNPVLANQHAVLGFVILGRGSWVFFLQSFQSPLWEDDPILQAYLFKWVDDQTPRYDI